MIIFIFDAYKYNEFSLEILRFPPHKYSHRHKGSEGWINASQASLASSCLSGKTGRARRELGEREGGG